MPFIKYIKVIFIFFLFWSYIRYLTKNIYINIFKKDISINFNNKFENKKIMNFLKSLFTKDKEKNEI